MLIAACLLWLLSLAGPGAGRTAKAELRPTLGAVVKVAIDEDLGFVLGLA